MHHLTWAPGHPMKIENQLVVDGAWLERKGVVTFNFYRPPTIEWGEADKAEAVARPRAQGLSERPPAHRSVFGAPRAASARMKINHGLRARRHARHRQGHHPRTGEARHRPVEFQGGFAAQILGRFNGYLKAVILRVSEARDLGDFNRYQFYEHMKAYLASPPDVLRLDEKHTPEYDAMNCVAVIRLLHCISPKMRSQWKDVSAAGGS